MKNYLLPRLGTFFILIGLGLLVLFIASVFSGVMQLQLFLLSAAILLLGSVLQHRAPRPPSGRFGAINRLRGKNHEDDEEN